MLDTSFHQGAGLHSFTRHSAVFRRKHRIPGRMVVRQDCRRGVPAHRRLKQFADPDERRVDAATVDQINAQHALLSVQADDPHLFAVKLAHIELEHLTQHCRARDLEPIVAWLHRDALAKLDRGRDRRASGATNATDEVTQLMHGHTRQPQPAARAAEQRLRGLEIRQVRDQCQEFSVAHRRGPDGVDAIGWSVEGRQFTDLSRLCLDTLVH